MGKDSPYVPGWDCHGLPIEWKVEEAYRAKKLNKDEVDPVQFRAECRAYADKWVGLQKSQFQRLGVMGDWANPYLTMTYDAEAVIAGELLKFAESGQLYRGSKRSEEHTSELQSLMRISYAVFCLKTKNKQTKKVQH